MCHRVPSTPRLSPWLSPAAACQARAQGSQGIMLRIVLSQHLFPFHNLTIVRPFIAVKLQMNIKGREVHQNKGQTKAFEGAPSSAEAEKFRWGSGTASVGLLGSRTCCGIAGAHPCRVPALPSIPGLAEHMLYSYGREALAAPNINTECWLLMKCSLMTAARLWFSPGTNAGNSNNRE